jgi:hypothetical protein
MTGTTWDSGNKSASISFTGQSVPRIFASLPPDANAKLADAEIRAGWDRAVERVNARIRS